MLVQGREREPRIFGRMANPRVNEQSVAGLATTNKQKQSAESKRTNEVALLSLLSSFLSPLSSFLAFASAL